jgi:hypothetical protein
MQSTPADVYSLAAVSDKLPELVAVSGQPGASVLAVHPQIMVA